MESIELPESLKWRLNLVRETLLDVIQSSENQSSISRMKAILGIDQSIELLLSTTLPYKGVTVSRDWGLPRMLKEICVIEPSLESHRTPIEVVRRLRDRVQHDGIVPSLEDRRNMTAQAEAFVRDCVRVVFEIEIEQLSPISMIENREIREYLESSQKAITGEDYLESVTESAKAFHYGWVFFKQSQPNYRTWGDNLSEILVGSIGEAAANAAQLMGRYGSTDTDDMISEFASNFDRNIKSFSTRLALNEILEPIDLARLGVDISDFARFRENTPGVFETAGGPQPHVYVPQDFTPSRQDALFAFEFVLLTLPKLQTFTPKSEI